MSVALPIYQPQALGARCDICPLREQQPVPPHEATGHRHFTMVLEGVNKVEPGAQMPAAGRAGSFLARAFKVFGTDRRNVAIRLATCCRPKPETTDAELLEATECCRPRLLRELEAARTRDDELVLACGDYALQSLAGIGADGRTSLGDWRGYPVRPLADVPGSGIVFPVYDPAFVMRSNAYWPIWKMDVTRALGFAQGRLPLWKWPRLEVDNDFASLSLLRDFNRAADRGPIRLGFDVETGGTSAFESPLLCLGLGGVGPGFDGAVSLTWPFCDDALDMQTRALLRHPNVTLELQNANHDLVTAYVNQLEISCSTHDILPDSRVAFPQVDHGLQFTALVFHFVEQWKALFGVTRDVKGKDGWIKAFATPDRARRGRIYNAQDCYMTAITQPPLTRMLERQH